MFDWLFEGQITVYLLLGLAFIFLLFVYWQGRRRVWLYAAVAVLALIGLYTLLDRLVETDREQIQRKIEEIANRLQAHNVSGAFEDISDKFVSPAGFDKNTLQNLANTQIGSITEVRVRSFQFSSRPTRGQDFDGLRFMFKVTGAGVDGIPFDCQPLFEYDPKKGWLLKGLKIFKFGTTEEQPVPF